MEADASAPEGRLLVIGNFDGVHLGHQAVLRGAAAEAEQRGLRPSVLSFDPHPAAVLGRVPPPILTTLAQKREVVHQVAPGVEFIAWPFTLELSALTPEAFAEEILVNELTARVVVVGQNFRFGRGRSGDLAVLKELGGRLGFQARAEPLRGDARGAFSSTRVRQALSEGKVEEASAVLGRFHRILGRVGRGDQRGRTLGFPTANLESIPVALPRAGVYCGVAFRGEASWPCVMSLGHRPTVDRPPSVEVHLLDFDGDLYGEELCVDVVARLREIERFDDLSALRTQIQRDVALARSRLGEIRGSTHAARHLCSTGEP